MKFIQLLYLLQYNHAHTKKKKSKKPYYLFSSLTILVRIITKTSSHAIKTIQSTRDVILIP